MERIQGETENIEKLHLAIISSLGITDGLIEQIKAFISANSNTLSGNTGLVSAIDGVWALEKEKCTEHKGKLTIANHDT